MQIDLGGMTEVSVPAKTDSRYVTLDLPSRCAFYQNKDSIQIRPFNLLDLKKVFKANKRGDLKMIAEVIDNCLTPDVSAFNLTVGDFWFLMYWQRLNSYNKHPWVIKYKCEGEAHKNSVALWKAATIQERFDDSKLAPELQQMRSPETLEQKAGFGKQDLTEIKLDVDKVGEFITRINKEFNILLYPPTVADTVENLVIMGELAEVAERELQDKMAKAKGKRVASTPSQEETTPDELMMKALRGQVDNLEEDWWLTLATNINRQYGVTLKERSRWLERKVEAGELSNDFLVAIDEFEVIARHGVQEHIECVCDSCGHKNRVEVSVAAHDFFPGV